MIIGHLPSGYIAAKLLLKKYWSVEDNPKIFLAFGTLGAFAPDFDMLYFYLIDKRQHHHHTYWPHYPTVWLAIASVCIFWYYKSKNKYWPKLCLLFSVGGFLHLLLDTIVGDIWWGAPFFDFPFAFFTIPALFNPWWLNFVLHWSFLFEVMLVVWAVYLWRKGLGL